jgi:hypothetical protein
VKRNARGKLSVTSEASPKDPTRIDRCPMSNRRPRAKTARGLPREKQTFGGALKFSHEHMISLAPVEGFELPTY